MIENNKIPKHWKMKRLGDVAKIKGGKRLPKGDVYSEGITNFPYIRVTDFENQTINTKKLKYLNASTQKAIKNYTISKNDVFISIAGTIGTTGTIPIKLDGSNLTENAAKITDLQGCYNKYISHFLSSFLGQSQIKEYTKTTTQPKLSLYRIEQIQFPFPPYSEQVAIVSKIDELLSDLENGKQQLLIAQQQLKVYRQSLLKWAFEGRFGFAQRPGNCVKEGKLPKGWKWVKIEDIATVGTGSTPLKGNKEYYNNGKIAWVTSGALNNEFVKEATDYVTEKALKETNLSLYPINTLLLAMYGEGKTRGKCSELQIEATTNQAIAAIHFKNHDIRVKTFLKYFLLKNYNDIRRLSSGGVQPNLNLGIVKKTLFPFPSFEEQQFIVDELESKLTVCDKIEETIIQSLQQAETLRQSILKKAFEGKLVSVE